MSKKIMIDTSEILENTEGQADAETLKANIEEITKVIEESKRILSELYEMAGMAQEEDEDIKGLASLQLFADPEEKEEAAGEKPKRRPPLPTIKNYALMNDKVTNVLSKTDAPFFIDNNGNLKLICKVKQGENKDTRKPITTGIALTYEGAKLNQRINAFDISVYNAITTNFFYWKKEYSGDLYITPGEIWRTMNGKTGNETPTNDQLDRVISSVNKMSSIRCEIDMSEDIVEKKIKLNGSTFDTLLIQGNLLLTRCVVIANEKGVKMRSYRIREEPILYEYNSIKKRLIYFDYELLDTSDEVANTENVIEFRNYLILQIQLMKNGPRNNNKILFSTIYQSTGIKPPEERVKRENYTSETSYKNKIRQERMKDKKKILSILKSWKKKNFISDFKEVKKRNAVIGVTIFF